MKAFSIFALVVLTFAAHASNKQTYENTPNPVIRSSNDVTFVCTQYTSNKYVGKQLVTDNAPIAAKTTVIQTKEGFIINKGSAFPERHILTNDQLGAAAVMAGDPTTLLLKKENSSGSPYFITYLFEDAAHPAAKDGVGPIRGLVVMADCLATN